MAKNEERKEKQTINSSVTRRHVLLQQTTQKQVDDNLEFKLAISIWGDREPPREHIAGVVFRFQVL